MSPAARRSILRWFHIILAIPIVGYIYSPFEVLPQYATPTRFVFLPAIVLSGLWMWKGHLVRRLFSRAPVRDNAGEPMPVRSTDR